MFRKLICPILFIAVSSTALAQNETAIKIRVVDGKTGAAITPDNLQVRYKIHDSIRTAWVSQKDDGTTEFKVPEGATAISARATYESSTSYYVNCDVAKQRKTTTESWYPLADILSGGIKIPNECIKEKDADKLNVEVKPGEFVLLVRKKIWLEGAQD